MVSGAARAAARAEEPGAAIPRARRQRAPTGSFECLAVDIKANRAFFEKYLGCRLTEQIVLDDGRKRPCG